MMMREEYNVRIMHKRGKEPARTHRVFNNYPSIGEAHIKAHDVLFQILRDNRKMYNTHKFHIFELSNSFCVMGLNGQPIETYYLRMKFTIKI